jgi:SAM-dependent methyltransferase
MDAATEARLAREQKYHNERFTEEIRQSQGKYYAAVKHGAQEFQAQLAKLAPAADILEYGCGNNSKAFEFNKVCHSIVGIDISDLAVKASNERAAAKGFTNTSFQVMNAEEMTFPASCFDLVYGRGIIHHLNLEKSFREIARVLRPAGTALFWEPLGHNPLINSYRRATPDARTVDEHPLLRQDFDLVRPYFRDVAISFYGLTTLASVPFRDTPLGDALLRATAAVDRALFLMPGLKWHAWFCIMKLSNPIKD